MSQITTIDQLEDLYGAPSGLELVKVADHLTPLYWEWISRARFCVLATVGPEGVDASPRGDDGPVVKAPDPNTLLLPDWRGNTRKDSLHNVVRDPRVSLMFMVPGSDNVVRVIGEAQIRTDAELLAQFSDRGTLPRSVLVISLSEVYFQCARAVKRAQLWQRDDSKGLPTAGQLVQEQKSDFDGAAYDAAWPDRAQETLW